MRALAEVAGASLLLSSFFCGLGVLSAGCGGFKDAASDTGNGGGATEAGAAEGGSSSGSVPPPPADGGTGAADTGGGGPTDAGAASDASTKVTMETLVTGRSKLGARATAAFGAWGGGIALKGNKVYWVEGGTTPGLYAASTSPCATACIDTIATFTRPSAFAATPTMLWVADITTVKGFPYGAGTGSIASSTAEIVNLVTDGTSVFWSEGDSQTLEKTVPGGSTTTLAYSNGTPISMAVAGSEVFWTGVDISGQLGAMQAVHADTTGGREVSRFSSGFDTMRGNATFLYYAKDSPATIHRLTLATGHDETVATDASFVSDFAVDDSYAYWVERGDGPDYLNGRVRRIAHDSMKDEVLAVSLPRPVAITVSGNTAYVASAGAKSGNYVDGKILKLTMSP
jgi:hypothetical protein